MKYSLVFLVLIFFTVLSFSSCNSANADNKNAIDPTDASATASGQNADKTNKKGNIKPFVSKEGRFSALFPGLPKKQIQSTPTEVGPIEITMHLYQDGVTLAYYVGYSDYPENIIKNVDTNELLEDAQKGAVSSIKGEIIDSEDIMLDKKYLGKHFTAKSSKIYLIYEMYLVKNRLYHIAVMSTQSLTDSSASKNFMESFKLLPTTDEVE